MLPERTTPELPYLEAKFAGLASYGLSAKLLAEVLPLGRPLHATVLRRQVQAVAQRLEDELGEERCSFIEGCPGEWEKLPRPDLPLVVGLDGGYVHSSEQRSRRDGWFEVVAGKSMPDEGPAKSFGFVQAYDAKPKRRLFEVLASQGMQANQAVTFITDGGEDVRELPSVPEPGGRPPPRLVPRDHAHHRHGQHGQRACAPRHRTMTSRLHRRATSPPASARSWGASSGSSGTATSSEPYRSSTTW